MKKTIDDLKRRAGMINEDVVPFQRPEKPQAQPQAADPTAARDRRIQAMGELSEALAEELWETRQDKEAVKAHLKDVVNNLVMSVMFKFSEED